MLLYSLQDWVEDYMCICLPGYTNKNCSENIDDCQDAECPGNSSCVDYVNEFRCLCDKGFTGENCTEGMYTKINGED